MRIDAREFKRYSLLELPIRRLIFFFLSQLLREENYFTYIDDVKNSHGLYFHRMYIHQFQIHMARSTFI